MLSAMRGAFPSEVLKVWFYAAASVLLGAWASPLIYNAGKALAEVSSVKQTNGALQWLAGVCQASDFPKFFEASLIGSAALLFLPFLHWLQFRSVLSRGRHFPDKLRGWNGGQRLQGNSRGLRQGTTGFLSVVLIFALIAGGLILSGVFAWKPPNGSMAAIALQGFATALGLAIFQELLFRGIALGIFLRAMRPLMAIALSALLFALVHFLNPPVGLDVIDPDASGIGFELLRKIVIRFSELRIVLGTFIPLLALGAVLGYARWRTASLWLSIGIHAGLLFVNDVVASITVAEGLPNILSGPSFQQGLIPLVGILLAGVFTHYLTRTHDATAALA